MMGNSPLFDNEKKTRTMSFGHVYSAYVSKNGKYLNVQIIKELEDGGEELITCPVRLNSTSKNITASLEGNGANILVRELYKPKAAEEKDETPF